MCTLAAAFKSLTRLTLIYLHQNKTQVDQLKRQLAMMSEARQSLPHPHTNTTEHTGGPTQEAARDERRVGARNAPQSVGCGCPRARVIGCKQT